MPSLNPPMYSEIFWRPLTEDVEDLLCRFQHTDSVRYEDFSAVWRDMAFSDVFRGIISNAVMKRFCRVALATAYKYFLPPYSYQIQVGGLYLMHAFYHTQLATPRVKIRLPLKDWHHVQKVLKDSVTSGHHDVVYIWQKLVAIKAIHYTAMPHFLAYRKPKNPKREPVCAEFLGRCRKVQEFISSEALEEVTDIQSRYNKMKKAFMEKNCHITVVHEDFSTHLYKSMHEFHLWQKKAFPTESQDEHSSDEENPSENECSKKAQLLASIKSRSYSTYQKASKARRNRQAETVDASGSGTEHEEKTSRRKRPPSLKARTCQKLGTSEERGSYYPWRLEASDDKFEVNRALRAADQDQVLLSELSYI